MDNTEIMSRDKFLEILSNYYSSIYEKDVKVNYRLEINNDCDITKEHAEPLIISFYFIEFVSGKCTETLVPTEDIAKALSHYAIMKDESLKEFHYTGGIHHVGYSYDADTPHFDGIVLLYNEKVKSRTRRRKITHGRPIIN